MKKWVLGGFGQPLIEQGQATIASVLKSKGYKTAAVGKWHAGLQWYLKDGSPARAADNNDTLMSYDGLDIDYTHKVTGGPVELGFDSFFGIAGSLDMPPYCFIENDKIPNVPTKVKELCYPQQRKGVRSDDWDDFKVDSVFAEKAVGFIDSHVESRTDNPFFLYLTLSAPHRPCLPPDEFKGSSQALHRLEQEVIWS